MYSILVALSTYVYRFLHYFLRIWPLCSQHCGFATFVAFSYVPFINYYWITVITDYLNTYILHKIPISSHDRLFPMLSGDSQWIGTPVENEVALGKDAQVLSIVISKSKPSICKGDFQTKKQFNFHAILGCFQCYQGLPMIRYTYPRDHNNW